MGRGWSIFGRGASGFLEKAILNFTLQFLFDLLFTCRLKDVVSLVIFSLKFLALWKVFFIVFHFINSLFKRKRVYKLIQVTIKIIKISYFEEESGFKIMWFVEGEGLTRKFLLRRRYDV